MKEKLEKLVLLCESSFSLDYNPHKDNYETIEKYIEVILMCNSDETLGDIVDLDVYNKMIEKNKMFELIIHPDTPVGFYHIFHYDLDMLLDKALKIFE